MEEVEYKKRYKARLMEWGLDEAFAQETVDGVEFYPSDPEPEDHADDCVSYMTEDA